MLKATDDGRRRACCTHMEDYLQTEFPHLNVWPPPPNNEAVIADARTSAQGDCAARRKEHRSVAGSLPHMAVAEGKMCGVPTRLFRVSISPANSFESQRTCGPRPVKCGRQLLSRRFYQGYMAPRRARACAPKRVIIVGQDTDGTVTPDDAGMAGLSQEERRTSSVSAACSARI